MSDQDDWNNHFVVTKQLALKELKATLVECYHEPTGARVMHIENDDLENLFCLSFETLPSDSSGVAHVLEHVVLCGSEKFPVKDPFFLMTRRSLNTFMNALTGADFTCYPAASQVEKDFYNLLEVYLDAVFYPQLKRESFLQEGCRLTFTEPGNIRSRLEWKGVVYNEMKGALSSPDTHLWYTMMRALLPDLTYAHIAGGSPKEIPLLTYEEMIKFYKLYYHPSRCLFFFYGNLPLKNHLDFIEKKILRGAVKLPPLPRSMTQKRFTSSVKREEFYPLALLKKGERVQDKSMLALGWLTVPIQEQERVLAITLLNMILMETDASLLKLPLLRSGLCHSAEGYLDTEMSEIPYLIVFKGCSPKNLDSLEALLFSSLQEIVKTGVPSSLIEAALHQLELSRLEISGDRAPFGLTLFMRAALAKQHGSPPENGLIIYTLFETLREQLKDHSYFTKLIQTYLIDNPHRVRLDFHPDRNRAQREAKEEMKNLDSLSKSLSIEEKERIARESRQLADYQKKIENQTFDCLPKIMSHEIPILATDFLLQQSDNIFFHSTFTNHLVYVDLVFDLPDIAEEDLPYARLLTMLLPELGVGDKSYIETLDYLQSHLGVLSMELSLHVQVESPLKMRPAITVHAKALERNVPILFSFLKEWLLKVRFDETKRIQELILKIYTILQHRFQKNSLKYAAQLALSGFSLSEKISEAWGGLSYFKTIEKIFPLASGRNPKKFHQLMKRLESLKASLLSLHNPHLIMSCDEASYLTCQREDFFGLLDLPKGSFKPWIGEYSLKEVASQGKIIASPVAFSCEAFKVAPFLHPHSSAITLATYILDHKVLFPKIREQGGAYGCGATYNSTTGNFVLHASQDPNIASTLKTFNEAITLIAEKGVDESDVESAKLEAIQYLDSPVDPGSRGKVSYNRYRSGRDLRQRQRHRDQLLALTQQDIKLAVEKELLPKINRGTTVVFASKQLLEKENKKLENPLPITFT